LRNQIVVHAKDNPVRQLFLDSSKAFLEGRFKATVLIYASGKAVIAGLKSLKDIVPLVQKLSDVIEPYV
jgi:hypothetical protein